MHLACLEWPGEVGLAGHSDGDVVAHACCDALFSAAGLGDLGSNFGTAEPRWKGASGTALLSEAARRVREAGFEIGNIAVQLVGERPRVAARSAEASRALSEAASARVSFSATTTDHLGSWAALRACSPSPPPWSTRCPGPPVVAEPPGALDRLLSAAEPQESRRQAQPRGTCRPLARAAGASLRAGPAKTLRPSGHRWPAAR